MSSPSKVRNCHLFQNLLWNSQLLISYLGVCWSWGSGSVIIVASAFSWEESGGLLWILTSHPSFTPSGNTRVLKLFLLLMIFVFSIFSASSFFINFIFFTPDLFLIGGFYPYLYLGCQTYSQLMFVLSNLTSSKGFGCLTAGFNPLRPSSSSLSLWPFVHFHPW